MTTTLQLIHGALAEDIGPGDLTAGHFTPADARCQAAIVAKAEGVIAGCQVAAATFTTHDPALGEQWNWNPRGREKSWEPYWVNTAGSLARAMEFNPYLRVLVASGYYDLVTPFFDAEFTLNRHGIGADRIDYRYYGGGHMMYVNEPSRTRLLEDVRRFIAERSTSN